MFSGNKKNKKVKNKDNGEKIYNWLKRLNSILEAPKKANDKEWLTPFEKWLFLTAWIFAVSIFVGLFCYYLYVKFEIIKSQYLVTKLKLQNHQLLMQKRELNIEYESVASLKKIMEEARSLGMKEPTPKDLIYLKHKKNIQFALK